MISNPLQTKSAYNTNRFLQAPVKGFFNLHEWLNDRSTWIYWFDDFSFTSKLTTAAVDEEQQYTSYIDTGNTIAMLATEKNRGVLSLATDATDNDAPVVTMCGNVGNSFLLDDNTAADRRLFGFDSRWRKSSVTDNQASIFIGLTEEARAVNDGVLTDDTGALISTIDGIGYRVLQDNGEELDFTYQKASQTNQEIADICSTTNTASGDLAASTWIKTGFVYNPAFPTDRRIKLYVNGVEYSTYVTATNMAAATFPDGEELVFSASLKNGEGTACSFDLDWILLYQKHLDT